MVVKLFSLAWLIRSNKLQCFYTKFFFHIGLMIESDSRSLCKQRVIRSPAFNVGPSLVDAHSRQNWNLFQGTSTLAYFAL